MSNHPTTVVFKLVVLNLPLEHQIVASVLLDRTCLR